MDPKSTLKNSTAEGRRARLRALEAKYIHSLLGVAIGTALDAAELGGGGSGFVGFSGFSGSSGASPSSLWEELAAGVHTQELVRKLFRDRQNLSEGDRFEIEIDGDPLKLENQRQLVEFKQAVAGTSHGAPPPALTDWQQAERSKVGTFLFHGCPPAVSANIGIEGLLVRPKPTHGRLLKDGIYGAPSPQKAFKYTQERGAAQDWHFMFLCRFNLKDAKHGNSNGGHEFCVPDPQKVVVLWQIKVKKKEVAATSSTQPTLNETVEILKRELGLKGNMQSVVQQAAEQLGVDVSLPLVEKARQCLQNLGVP